MKPAWVGGTKVCSRGLGYMTNMAIIPIYQGHRFCYLSKFLSDISSEVTGLIEAIFHMESLLSQGGAVVEWLEQLGYGAESRRIA